MIFAVGCGVQEKTSTQTIRILEQASEEAMTALLSNVQITKKMFEQGVVVQSQSGLGLLDVGPKHFEDWRSGIESYGVEYHRDKLHAISRTYQSPLPDNLVKVAEGQWKGALRTHDGNLVMAGLRYFSDEALKSQVLSEMKLIATIIEEKRTQATIELFQLSAFWSSHKEGYTNEVFQQALSHKDWPVRKGAILDAAKNEMAGVDKARLFVQFLEDSAAPVRAEAARHLCAMKDKRAVVPLMGGLRDEAGLVRFWCALALGELRFGGAIGLLRNAAKVDSWRTVCIAAQHAIQKVKQESLSPVPKVKIEPFDTVETGEAFQQTLTRMKNLHYLNRSFLDIRKQFNELLDRSSLAHQKETTNSVLYVLKELDTLRSLAMGEKLLLDLESGGVMVFGLETVEYLGQGLENFGLLLPEAGWEHGASLGAAQADENLWRTARNQIITEGRWAGAYRIGEGYVLLPGLKCFGAL